MLSVSYAGNNANSAGKTSVILRGPAFGAYMGFVLAHCVCVCVCEVRPHLEFSPIFFPICILMPPLSVLFLKLISKQTIY